MAEPNYTPEHLDPHFLDDLSSRIASAVREQTGLAVSKVRIEQPLTGPDERNRMTVYVEVRKLDRKIPGTQTIEMIRSTTDAVHRVRTDLYPVIVPRFANGQRVA